MDELVSQELAKYNENSMEFLHTIFAAQPFIMSQDILGYKNMLQSNHLNHLTTIPQTLRIINICGYCKSNNLVYEDKEAAIICKDCATEQNYRGNSADILKANAKFMGHNRIDSPHYYERKSHFIHIINELTGKCATKIPSRVFEVVKKGEITLQGARSSLRKAKLSEYICAVPRILESLSPHSCVSVSNENIRSLLMDFKEVSWAWDRIRHKIAPKRKSFIAYPFVLKKLCERRNMEYLCRDVKRVKSAQASALLEKYWKAITKKLNWNR